MCSTASDRDLARQQQPPRRRFTVDEYEQMIAAGIVREGERVELLDGEIVQMCAMNGRHAACLDRLNRLCNRRTDETVIVRVRAPIRVGSHAQPEPDIALLRHRPDFYEHGHPGPDDVLLVIEVCDTSVGYDRRVKLPMYARAMIAEVWLVDLVTRVVVIHRDPRAGRYRTLTTHADDASLTPVALPALTIRVDEIIAPPTGE